MTRLRTPALLLLAALAALLAAKQYRQAVHTPALGYDLRPLRDAGRALINGRDVYNVFDFVYPPPAAVLGLPLALPAFMAAAKLWTLLSLAGVAGATFASICQRRSWTLAFIAAVVVIVVLKSDVLTDSLWLLNISLLLVPVAVAVVLLYAHDRWTVAVALLALSLIIKPLLAPLLLVPAVRRKWRELIIGCAPAAVLLLIGVAVVPGGSRLPSVLVHIASGSTLRGDLATYNLSARGLAEAQHAVWAGWVVAAIVVLAALAVLTRYARSPMRPEVPAAVAFLAFLLAGSLSESHFLLVAVPLVAASLAAQPSRWPLLLGAVALLVLSVPRYYLGGVGGSPEALQARYFAGQLLLFAVVVVQGLQRDRTLFQRKSA